MTQKINGTVSVQSLSAGYVSSNKLTAVTKCPTDYISRLCEIALKYIFEKWTVVVRWQQRVGSDLLESTCSLKLLVVVCLLLSKSHAAR